MASCLGRDENIDYTIGKGAWKTPAYFWDRNDYISAVPRGAEELRHSGFVSDRKVRCTGLIGVNCIRTLLSKSLAESPNSASFGLTPAVSAGTILGTLARRTLRESIWLCARLFRRAPTDLT